MEANGLTVPAETMGLVGIAKIPGSTTTRKIDRLQMSSFTTGKSKEKSKYVDNF